MSAVEDTGPVPSGQAVRFLHGDACEVLSGLEDQSVHSCITSPPYFNLRTYNGGVAEIGGEKTPQEYVSALLSVFQQVWRVLRDDGLLFLVLGDSFNAAGRVGHGTRKGYKQQTNRASATGQDSPRPSAPHLREKNLIGIPWRVAFALQDDGWILRQEIIWSKPAPMPESVKDRATRAHETIFMFAKNPKYYYDQEAIREPFVMKPQRRLTQRHSARDAAMQADRKGFYQLRDEKAIEGNPAGRNIRSVWTVNSTPFSSKKFGLETEHYASFPCELVRPMIKCSTSEVGVCPSCLAPYERQVMRQGMVIKRSERRDKMGEQGRTQSSGTMLSPASSVTTGWLPGCTCDAGEPQPAVILDPFAGAGTSLLVARQEQRHAIGIDLNADYLELARRRIQFELGLFSGLLP